MKVLKVELSNPKINSYADIELPSSYEGMEDALYRARMTPQYKEVYI